MGFPGGGYEDTDACLRETAERECREELGIDLRWEADFLTMINRMNHPKITVDAFVYHVKTQRDLTPNSEVAKYFWLSLADLVAEQNRTTIEHSFEGAMHRFPAIILPHVPVPIWGISLGFLDQLFLRWRQVQ